jgi:hypothetical protein
MKLETIIEQGYVLCSWAIRKIHNERRVVLKLNKKTSRGERHYVAHSPYTGAKLADVEFTEPILLK